MEIVEEASDIFSFQLLSPSYCQKLVRWASRDLRWNRGRVYAGPRRLQDAASRRCLERTVAGLPPPWNELAQACREKALSAARLCWRERFRRLTGARLVRYDPGGYFKMHCDFLPSLRVKPRFLSLVCYLNEDFSGGRTAFPRQAHDIVPKTGKAVLFPSSITHPHEAQAVREGTRYVIVAWVE